MAFELDRERIDAVVQAVADRLDGDWILVGGALVALWIEPRRVTEDVDLVGVTASADQRLALLALAQELGLPLEALNSAADFFVYRIADWRDEIEFFRQGARGRIFRPTPTLFLLLKVERLTEHDLADCLAVLERAHRDGLRLDRKRVVAALAALPETNDPQMTERRSRLIAALAG